MLVGVCFTLQAQVNIITTIAGRDSIGFSGDDGPAIFAKLNFPESVWIDKQDNLYIADAFNNRIRKIEKNTGIISTIAGTGIGGYSGDSGLAVNAQLYIPTAIATDSSNNIYIADAVNNRIRRINSATNIITTIAGTGVASDSGDNGLAINAELNKPSGLILDKFGDVYFADNHNNKVRKITISSGVITTIAGTGTLGYSGDNNAAVDAELNGPGQVFADSFGNILFSDYHNSAIRKVDISTGIITTIAGNGTSGYSGDSGPAANALLNQPLGLYVDKQQDIFIAEFGNGVIRRIDGITGMISTVVGTGIPGFSGDNGAAIDAQIIPDDVFFDSYGNMYIADVGNYRIRKVQSGVGLNNVPCQKTLNIYPNPTTGKFTIKSDIKIGVKVISMFGEQVYRSSSNTSDTELDITAYPAGIYAVEVTNATTGMRSVEKIVKE